MEVHLERGKVCLGKLVKRGGQNPGKEAEDPLDQVVGHLEVKFLH